MAQIVTQPMPGRPVVKWHTDICDCCVDTNTCCYGFWCCPCLACTVSGQFGENQCFPLCDIFSPAILTALGIPLCVPPAGLALRAGMRNKFGIQGSPCLDVQEACCCSWCSWCQMHRELKYRRKTPTVINMLHQNVTNVQMQPAPGMMFQGYPAGAAYPNYPVVMTSY